MSDGSQDSGKAGAISIIDVWVNFSKHSENSIETSKAYYYRSTVGYKAYVMELDSYSDVSITVALLSPHLFCKKPVCTVKIDLKIVFDELENCTPQTNH